MMPAPLHFLWSRLWRSWTKLAARNPKRRQHGISEHLTDGFASVEQGRPLLAQVRQELETHFQRIGQDLETLAAGSGRVVSTGEKLLSLASGQADGDELLRRAIDTLLPPIQTLEDCLERSAVAVTQLRTQLENIAKVRRLEGRMQQIVAPLRFIQTAFRIESAVLEPEMRVIFTALTRDIEEMHLQVIGLFAEQFKSLDRAHIEIEALIHRLEPQIIAHRELAGEKKSLIERTLGELRQALEENRSRDIRLVDAARKLDGAVAGAVGAMQFQDITNQKLQHVESALDDMSKRLNSAAPGSGQAENGTDTWTFLNESGRVQTAQLALVEKELRQAEQSLATAFSIIVQESSAVDVECTALRSFQTISVEGDGVVQVVLNSLDELSSVVSASHAIQNEAYQTLLPLAGMASNLTGVIRGLSQSMRLIALNAQIQAAQVGSGTGLEVLSQRTCQIADEAGQANDSAATALEALIGGFDALVTECRSIEESTGAQLRWIEQEGGTIRGRLHEFRDQALAMFKELESTVESVREGARLALESLPFAERAATHLQKLGTPMKAWSESIAAPGTAKEASGQHMDAEALRNRYTMASERAVHSAVIAGAAVDTAEPTLFVPEIFTPISDAGAAISPDSDVKTEVPASPAPLGDNVELF